MKINGKLGKKYPINATFRSYVDPACPYFRENLRDLCIGFFILKSREDIRNNTIRNYELIKDWIKENKKYPSAYSKGVLEKKVGVLLNRYKKGKHKHSHADFIKEISSILKNLNILFGKDRILQNYSNIVEYIKKFKSIPSRYSKNLYEKKLGSLYTDYKRKNVKHNIFLKEVEEICKKLGMVNKISTNKLNITYSYIIDFVEKNKRTPRRSSKDKEEKRLGGIYCQYKTGPQKHRHMEFIKQVEKLLKELINED